MHENSKTKVGRYGDRHTDGKKNKAFMWSNSLYDKTRNISAVISYWCIYYTDS